MRLRQLPIAFFVIACCASPCLGQMTGGDDMPVSSTFVFQVSGIVRDTNSNEPIPRIRVSLTNMGSPEATTLTGADGQFSFPGIHNGRYHIQINVDGYEDFDQPVVIDRGSATVDIDLVKLAAAPPPTGPSVTVHELGVPQKAQNEFQKAHDLMSAKSDYHDAIAEFDRAIHDYPDYYEAYAMEGSAYLALSDPTSAERVLRKSIDLSAGKYPAALYLLAGLLNSANRFSEAEAPARQCIALDENAWGGYFELARALLGLGKLDEAQTSAMKSRDLKPDNPKVYLLLANIHTTQQDYPALLQDLDRYLALNPTGPMADQARKEQAQLKQAMVAAQPAVSPPPPQPQQ
jgi:Tfp pilus assembly protein PilF